MDSIPPPLPEPAPPGTACRLLLEKFYIGNLDVRPGQQLEVIEYEEDLQEGQFFAVLKRRVEKYFKSNGVSRRLCSHAVTACCHRWLGAARSKGHRRWACHAVAARTPLRRPCVQLLGQTSGGQHALCAACRSTPASRRQW